MPGSLAPSAWDQVTPRVWARHHRHQPDRGLAHHRRSCAHLIAAGGGSIICTSSTAGIKGLPFLAPYVAAKHGIVGIAKSMANELAHHRIRVNTVHPAGVDTPMVAGLNLAGELADNPALGPIFMNALPVQLWTRDVSNAVLFLASDEARHVTGLEFTVDAGCTIR